MAAHIKTALKQVRDSIENNSVDFGFLQAALNISCWTEDLEYDHYRYLASVVERTDVSDLKKFLDMVQFKYHSKWVALGRPKTREQWREKEYGLKP